MEWVEITAKSVEEATAIALDRLGVAEDDAEIEVLDEPKTGLFGRVRGEARVRARVRPTPARARQDRRERRRRGGSDAGSDGGSDRATPSGSAGDAERPARGRERGDRSRTRRGGDKPRSERSSGGRGERSDQPVDRQEKTMEANNERAPRQAVDAGQVGEEARKFVAGLVEAFGMTATTRLAGEGTELEVHVEGEDIGLLVGPRGTTLQAVQDLARVASQRRLGDHDTRLRVDIGGYRERRQQALAAFAQRMAEEVLATGTGRVLEPMGSSDRKAIHDALTDVAGVETRSEGEDPFRRVVILPVS